MITATSFLSRGPATWTGFCPILHISRRSYFLGGYCGCLPFGPHVGARNVSVRICELGITIDAGNAFTIGADDVGICFWVILASRPANPNSAGTKIGSLGP